MNRLGTPNRPTDSLNRLAGLVARTNGQNELTETDQPSADHLAFRNARAHIRKFLPGCRSEAIARPDEDDR